MANVFEGNLVADKNDRFCIVVSRFNEFIGSKLFIRCKRCLLFATVWKIKNIDIVWVPGAFEIPLAAKKAAKKGYAAIVTLGAVIKGSTSHYDYVCAEVSKGVAHVSLETETPVIFGVLTTENIEQAIERAGTKAGNKGSEAAETAIEMANLFKTV